VLLGWLVAGETLDARILLAAGLVIGAVVLITLPPTLFRARVKEPSIEERRRPEPIRQRCSETSASTSSAARGTWR
jgi:hypothetical protein